MNRHDPAAPLVRPEAARRRALVTGAAAALGALALGGCVIAPVPHRRGGWEPAHPGYPADSYPRAPSEGPVVEVPPPEPRYEVVPVAPSPGWIWIGGYWTWHLGRHVWIGGRWSAPLAGHVWVAPRWHPVGPRSWRYHGGYWRRG